MTEPQQVTYACPVPGCEWRITDTHKETLSAEVILQLAEKQGFAREGVAAELAHDHDQKLAATIGQHLRTHPDLRHDPNVSAAAGYLIARTRAELTTGKDEGR